MHAYIHTCMHSYIHTYIHKSIQPLIHTYIHANIHTYMHAYIHACIHTYMHAKLHASMHAYIHPYIHAYIHTYIRTCIRMYMELRTPRIERDSCHSWKIFRQSKTCSTNVMNVSNRHDPLRTLSISVTFRYECYECATNDGKLTFVLNTSWLCVNVA